MFEALSHHHITAVGIAREHGHFPISTHRADVRLPPCLFVQSHAVSHFPCTPPVAEKGAALPAVEKTLSVIAGPGDELFVNQPLIVHLGKLFKGTFHFRLHGAVDGIAASVINPLLRKCPIQGEDIVGHIASAGIACYLRIDYKAHCLALAVPAGILYQELLQDIIDVLHGLGLFQAAFVHPVFSQPQDPRPVGDFRGRQSHQLSVEHGCLQAHAVIGIIDLLDFVAGAVFIDLCQVRNQVVLIQLL